jgi:hypothetical protein
MNTEQGIKTQYKPGDVVVLTQIATDARWPTGAPAGIRIGKVFRVLEDGRFRVKLRMGNMGGFSGGCKFAPKARTVDAANIVRLASSREIQMGAVSVILPLAVAS